MSTVDLLGCASPTAPPRSCTASISRSRRASSWSLVGPSGCGKSTLLRMIAGLEKRHRRRDPHRRPLGQRASTRKRPQRRDGVPELRALSAYDRRARTWRFEPADLAALPSAEIRQRVDEAAALLELTPILDRRPSQLSGGQRQRVAMGRAIVRDPAVFLFDEPLSNLDAKLRVQMRAEIARCTSSSATTTIYVTHDQIEAMTLADRIVVHERRRIEQVGTPARALRRPANRFVAGFIGSPAMNFLPGRVAGGKVRDRRHRGRARPRAGSTCRPTARVEIGLRPEHLRPPPRPGDRDPGAAGGAHRVADPPPRRFRRAQPRHRARRHGRARPRPADHPRDRPEHVHIFAADSGEAIGLAAAGPATEEGTTRHGRSHPGPAPEAFGAAAAEGAGGARHRHLQRDRRPVRARPGAAVAGRHRPRRRSTPRRSTTAARTARATAWS